MVGTYQQAIFEAPKKKSTMVKVYRSISVLPPLRLRSRQLPFFDLSAASVKGPPGPALSLSFGFSSE